MPTLDLSEALLDPLTGDSVTVVRRRQLVSDSGRAEMVEQQIPGVFGVINAAGPDTLDRLKDMESMGRVLTFVTRFKLWGPAEVQNTQYQPDVVQYRDTEYTVVEIDPYPQYGSGFVQAVMGSRRTIDPPTSDIPNAVGTLNFSTTINSGVSPLVTRA